MLLAADRYLTDKVIPGTRCVVMGIYTVTAESKEVRSANDQCYWCMYS